ncbi:MAG: ferredoxin family protein [Capsulimonas sp.]|jgi:ferredoxin|uniref:4Fe-4S dicluster domain-containing protein n=1 Tax=Capsulimonas sp. TaxID=2494211 RepID=UPI003267B79D|nr:Formate hydrogenlyase subunit 6/NADH:ubiquinone oxidoreductase 23 kD subunit [Capsulimonas sp.]
MAYVITEPCAGTKDKSCVAVCPVDCIHEGTVEVDGVMIDQLFIEPNECIDCGLCEPECPVDAIFMEDEVPAQWSQYIEINAEFYKSGKRA